MKNCYNIPLFSARASNVDLDLLNPIKRVVDSHWYVLGNEVTAFESEFASYCGVAECISLANGTDALELGLRAVGVQAGDPVILAANAGFYGSIALHLLGAIPHYVDIDPITLTLSPEKLQEALVIKPKAIIVTHLYGQLANIESIIEYALTAKIPVIEDCAQAHGAIRHGKRAGSFGTLGCFSFYPTKNLGALGDGGAIITDDPRIATRLRQLRQYGWGTKYHVDIPGGRNSRLDEIQAGILRTKLPYLDSWNAERRDIARQYNAAFSDLPIQIPPSLGKDYVAHLYVIRLKNRDALRQHLQNVGIATDTHYPMADHMQPAYSANSKQAILPVTELACKQVVSLPCFPGMKINEINQVIEAVTLYFK